MIDQPNHDQDASEVPLGARAPSAAPRGSIGQAAATDGHGDGGDGDAGGTGDDDLQALMRDAAPDLDAEALAAAESAIADGERALADARAAAESLGRITRERRSSAARAAPVRARAGARQRWLRVLLLVNLAMMGLVLVWPFEDESATHESVGTPVQRDRPRDTHPDEPGAARAAAGAAGGPLAEGEARPAAATGEGAGSNGSVANDPWQRPVRPAVPLKRHRLYVEALAAAERGDFDGSLDLLDRYLRAHPSLPPVERTIVLHAMAMYAVLANRVEVAQECERQIRKLKTRGYLPDDLIASARRAEAEGNGSEMRRLWARFLLQQRQLAPAQRKHVAEAYLELADGYRLEAEQGEEAAAAAARAAAARTAAAGATAGRPTVGRTAAGGTASSDEAGGTGKEADRATPPPRAPATEVR